MGFGTVLTQFAGVNPSLRQFGIGTVPFHGFSFSNFLFSSG